MQRKHLTVARSVVAADSSRVRSGRRIRWIASAFGFVFFAANAARAQEGPFTPWVGEPGITETVQEIMDRDARAGGESVEPSALQTHRHLIPNRSGLPQNPNSPATSQWPPSSGSSFGPPAAGPTTFGTPLSPQTVGTSFLGAQLSESGFIPPDSCGAVGPTQALVCANGRIKVFSKAGVLGGLNASTDSFFNSVRNGSGTSDCQVKYDRTSGRWFVTMVNVTSLNNRVLIAVSSGSTITNASSFTFFFFQQNLVSPAGDNNRFADYPKTGVDANAVYIGANMFTTTSFVGTTGFVVKKSSLTSGGPIVATAFRGMVSSGGGAGPASPTGVDNDDPSATEGYFVGPNNSSFGVIVLRRISNPGGTPSISGNLNVTVPTTGLPQQQPALGSTHTLDSLDDRLFNAMVHKNRETGVTSLWTAHNLEVNASGVFSGSGNRNGSRWYQIGSLSTTPTLTQSGTLFDSAATNPRGFWIPSLAMSGQGHMALGSSYAGAADHAGVAVAGRFASDALGTIQAPTLAVTSSSNYNVESSSPQRWGDFSATCVDPTDDQTIWTFEEYCNSGNSWGVRVVQLKAPPPATPTTANPATLNPGQTNVNVAIGGSSSAGSGFFDTEPGMNRIAASISGGGVTVNSITWTSGTQLTLNVDVAANAANGPRTLTITNPDGQSSVSASGIITIGFPDCNNNGIPDNIDILNGAPDCDGNGVPDVCQPDTDGDGTIDACDGCPNDATKTAPGVCGCGVPDVDSDGDGTLDCLDGCPNDPNKIAPGQCGCGIADIDSDGDGTADCVDGCPNDANKTAPGQCGCGVADTDSDGDGTADCHDGCPNDPNKTAPGICGCGVSDADSDGDGTVDCLDGCPNDPNKIAPGICGCGFPDVDSDGDGVLDCLDGCPSDPTKTAPGVCGCGQPDVDTDGDGFLDCQDNCPSIPNPGQEDCNQNGIGDVCDIASGFSLDVNADSIPDDCQGAGVEYCFGDGSGASCPCGNTDGFHSGCKNSTGDGARLYDQGGTSFANDDAVMTAIRLPHNKSGLLFMGKNQVSNPFGDGRLCISTGIKRFAIHSSGASGSIVQTNLVANSGGAIQAGSTWNFQAWYRDPQGPCGGTFNLSNAVQITFN